MLRRIKYISKFAKQLSAADIETIIEESEKNNAALGITGVLMASGGLFFQILEGPESEVAALYEKIVKDPRHTKVTMLADQRGVKERLFPDWNMKRLDLSQAAADRLEPLQTILGVMVSLSEDIEKLSLSLTHGIWREFVKNKED